ncbi:MAG: family 16 glycosylhydrolase [Clostridia bacterium]|nr:family 16 glycosylhydrolase [Clostridia bacterium]
MVPEGYKLVFEDDFNGDSLDTTKWRCRRSGKRRCGYNADSQVSVENGNLVIRQKYFDGEFGPGWYSGWVGAIPRFIRGYFEVRCICNKNVRSGPDINPFWSAFWVQARHPYEAEFSQGGPGGAEIDVVEALENFGGMPGIESNIHVKGMKTPPLLGDPTDHPPVVRLNIPDCFTAYHTYALEWTDKVYRFFCDGKMYFETSWGDGVSRVDEEVILSLEHAFSSEGIALDTESEYIIDYVRVYQKEDGVMVMPE